jgi:hypothetical protein
MTYVASIHMETYNRSWAQGGTPGYYAMYSTNQENGYAYFVGATTTGAPLNRLINITHSFTRIDVIAPTNDMVSLYKAKVKATTEFGNPLSAFASFPSVITSSGNFVLPNNALPLVNVLIAGGGGGAENHGGGGGGGGIVKLTAYQAVGTTSVTIGTTPGNNVGNTPGGSSFFGNVYAIGGGGGASVNNAGGNGANGGGAANHGSSGNTSNHGSGTIQTASTGLGTSGAPTYNGGFRGGFNNQPSHTGRHMGAGGGGGGGAGQDRTNFTGATAGGAGHSSDITGSSRFYSSGGGGADHDGQVNGNYSTERYIGAGANAGWNSNNNTVGHAGGVIVRYYIP